MAAFVGWQLSVCDPIWQVVLRGCEMGFPWRAIPFNYLVICCKWIWGALWSRLDCSRLPLYHRQCCRLHTGMFWQNLADALGHGIDEILAGIRILLWILHYYIFTIRRCLFTVLAGWQHCSRWRFEISDHFQFQVFKAD